MADRGHGRSGRSFASAGGVRFLRETKPCLAQDVCCPLSDAWWLVILIILAGIQAMALGEALDAMPAEIGKIETMTSGVPSAGDPFPATGRIAAVDFGSVRIGLAICDPDRILASPLEVHSAADWQNDGDYFRSLARTERIVGFVVGLPIHCDGGESQQEQGMPQVCALALR